MVTGASTRPPDGLPSMPHMAGPTRMSRIETDKRVLPHLPVSTEERAGNLIEACVARGTAHLHSHVDIDLEAVPLKLDRVLAARKRHRGQVSMQIVAFRQSGVRSRAEGLTNGSSVFIASCQYGLRILPFPPWPQPKGRSLIQYPVRAVQCRNQNLKNTMSS
jgi:hypothetical protein